MSLAAFSDLVEKIYDAAWEPSIWPHIPRDVTAIQDGALAMLFAVRLPGVEDGFQFVHGVSAGAMEAWSSGVARDDIWVKGGIEKGLFRSGNVVRGEDLVADEVFLASDFYRKFLRPQDSRYLLSGVLFDGTTDSLPTSVCSVIRGHAGPTFGPDNVALHRLLTNHLSKSMATMWRLRSRELEMASTYSALDRIPSPVMLMAAGGEVTFCNRAAQALLSACDGVRLRGGARRDRLAVDDADAQRSFDRLVQAAVASHRGREAGHFSAGLKVSRPSGNAAYVIQVAPLGARSHLSLEGAASRAIVFISDPALGGRLDANLMTTLYSLTRAVIRLAEALVGGATLGEAAATLGIKENTARTQLRGVFAKTGTSRQSQLMKLLVSLRAAP